MEQDQDRAEIYVRPSPWRRLLAMIVMMFCFSFGQSLLFLIAFVQFIWTLIDKEPNEKLLIFSESLSIWLQQTSRFLTFVTDDRPYPWTDWPTK